MSPRPRCPEAESGCLCERTEYDCQQGRTCPYRQPDPDEEDMSFVSSVLKTGAVAFLAVACVAAVVLPEHPDSWFPW